MDAENTALKQTGESLNVSPVNFEFENYFSQLTFPDFTSAEFVPTMITKSPGSQSYFKLLL